MTPDRFRECLDAIGWTGRELARRLEVDERQVRRWASGTEAPTRVAEWLETLAQTHETNPPPIRRAPPQALAFQIEWDSTHLPPANRLAEIEAAVRESEQIKRLGASPVLFNGKIILEHGDYVKASGRNTGSVLDCEYHP